MLLMYLTIFILITSFVKLDLPIHCLKREIVGSWKIIASDLFPVSNGYEMKCGHDLPSLEKSSWLAQSPLELKNEFILNLDENDNAEIKINSTKETGNWTMIYNQGFNLEFHDLSFYAFSKYEIRENPENEKIYNSLCYSTCVGWYRNQNSTKWGCYQAFKLNVDPNQITSYNTKFDSDAIEPEPKEKKERDTITHQFDNLKISSIYNKINDSNGGTNTIITKENHKVKDKFQISNVNLGFKDKKHLKLNEQNSLKSPNNESTEIDSKIFFSGDEYQDTQSLKKSKQSKGKRFQKSLKIRKTISSEKHNSYSNFLQKNYQKINQNNYQNLFENIKTHEIYVNQLDQVEKIWTAAVYPHFSQMSISELNRFAGRKKSAYNRGKRNTGKNEKQKNSGKNEDLSMFPKNFDWMSLVRQAGSQGQCGSCYIYATIRMIEARLKLNYKHEIKLSVQHPIDCSIYNQGCEGGYPFLVMKFADEYELLPEICKPYLEKESKCMENVCDMNSLPYRYKTRNYRYVGGSYGKCTERKIMEELMKNGPLVVSFAVDYNFMLYKNGIYHSIDNNSWVLENLTKPEWIKVDHSVLLVGWGEDKVTKQKYWIAQNTWGTKWGENGFFRVRRGTNEYGIESNCEAADPYIIDNKTGEEIDPIKNSADYTSN